MPAAPVGRSRPSGLEVLGLVVIAVLLASCSTAPTPAQLTDVTQQSGLSFRHGAFNWGTSADTIAMMGGGACWLDADDDGWLDLYAVNNWSEDEHARWTAEDSIPQSTLFHNDEGTFTDVGEQTQSALPVRGQGCLAADLDGDGATDLFVTTARSSVLLWNDGDGTFTPDDGSAGLNVYGWHTAAAAADVDGDGRLDVFVAGYVDPNARLAEATQGFPRTYAPVRDLLLRNTGEGADGHAAFEDVSDVAGIDADGARYGLGATFTDVDVDGDLDLLVANDTDPNRLYRNDSEPGRIRLTDIATAAGTDDDHSGMGVATGDLDGDGLADQFVTNMDDQGHTLLLNGQGPQGPLFTAPEDTADRSFLGEGLTGWGTSLVDLDGDTDLDVLIANGAIPVADLGEDAQPVLAYARQADGTLADASSTLGLDAVGNLLARGSAVADYDNDGDPDVVVMTIGGPAHLLATTGSDANWLVVDPQGREPGTVVTVTLPSGSTLVRELHAGSSYLSTEDPRALFGLGDSDHAEQVEVRWPDGTTRVVTDVRAGEELDVARPG